MKKVTIVRKPRKPKIITPWENIPDDIGKYFGFVYEVLYIPTNTRYIGRKFYWKGAGKKKKESDWKFYKTSSDVIKGMIETENGISNFKFVIIASFPRRCDVLYWESKLLFDNNVLWEKNPDGSFKYFNSNIMNRHYRKDFHTLNVSGKIACFNETDILYCNNLSEIPFGYTLIDIRNDK